MTRQLLRSLTILMLALFVAQDGLLMAQVADGGGTRDSLGLRLERRRELVPVSSRETSSEIPESDRGVGALGMAKTKVYKFRSIDYPGALFSYVRDFNGKTAVGEFVTTDDNAFTFHGSSYARLNVPGATASVGYAINTSGKIVGLYVDSSNHGHGFLYDGSRYTTIDYPGSIATSALDINDSGQIVGAYTDPSSVLHGFLYDKGTFTAINVPGAGETSASGINSGGDIAGSYGNGSTHGFLLKNGVYSSFDSPRGDETNVIGINDSGAIAGFYWDAGAVHGFTYSNGVFTQVDVPGAHDTLLCRIKNNGNVVGYLYDDQVEIHGVIGH